MRVVALLATYNERRFVVSCLEHLDAHGVSVYLIDNESTDETLELAEPFRARNLIGVETLPRTGGVFSLRAQLQRKQQLARELEADWFIHLDADELRLPPPGRRTLAEALHEVGARGYNAVNFLELSFVPTREQPAHDHPDYMRTLRSYYPLLPEFPHRLNAWRATDEVDLVWKAGHRVRFPGLSMFPVSFPMKHYLFLDVSHAIEKYVRRRFSEVEVEGGWHGWRETLDERDIRLPAESELRVARAGADLDPGNPSRYHCFDPRWTSPVAARGRVRA